MDHITFRHITRWIYRAMMLNALFLIFGLPIITLGASSTATLATAHHLRQEDADDIFSYFLSSFKAHFVVSTQVWVSMMCFGGAVVYNLVHFQPNGLVASIVWLIQWPLIFQVFIVILFVFSVLSRFEVNAMRAVKSAWILANRNLLLTIGMMGLTVIGLQLGRYIPALNIFLLAGLLHILQDIVLDYAVKRIRIDQKLEAH